MSLHHLAATAATVSNRASQLMNSSEPIPMESLERYWQASRGRMQTWSLRLHAAAFEPLTSESLRTRAEPLLSDIFVSEILTRVWTAVMVTAAERHDSSLGSVYRQVYCQHLDVRRDALRWLLRSDEHATHAAARIDRLRRRSERWTDLLLASLGRNPAAAEFANDVTRMRDYQRNGSATSLNELEGGSQRLIRTGLSTAFPSSLTGLPDTRSHHKEIVKAIHEAIASCGRAAESLSGV